MSQENYLSAKELFAKRHHDEQMSTPLNGGVGMLFNDVQPYYGIPCVPPTVEDYNEVVKNQDWTITKVPIPELLVECLMEMKDSVPKDRKRCLTQIILNFQCFKSCCIPETLTFTQDKVPKLYDLFKQVCQFYKIEDFNKVPLAPLYAIQHLIETGDKNLDKYEYLCMIFQFIFHKALFEDDCYVVSEDEGVWEPKHAWYKYVCPRHIDLTLMEWLSVMVWRDTHLVLDNYTYISELFQSEYKHVGEETYILKHGDDKMVCLTTYEESLKKEHSLKSPRSKKLKEEHEEYHEKYNKPRSTVIYFSPLHEAIAKHCIKVSEGTA